jgi:hypothetical protein
MERIAPKIRPQSATGEEYIELRKVSWDEMWHLVYKTSKGKLTWDRVNKQTALALADRI